MLNLLKNIFGPKTEEAILAKDRIAELLKTSPEALEAFESAYRKQILESDGLSDNLFDVNSRQAAADAKQRAVTDTEPSEDEKEEVLALADRIVDELLAQTESYVYDGKEGHYECMPKLPDGTPDVTNRDIQALPEGLRPQLTGNLLKKDCAGDSYPAVLTSYWNSLYGKNGEFRKQSYHMFRQGLDILDLDPILYEIIGTNPNSMGYWLPALAQVVKPGAFFQIPNTAVIKVPLPLLQLTRNDFFTLTPTTKYIVNQFCMKAFRLDEQKEYFIKTGTYSSKFDFRNAFVHGAEEVRELGEYLLFIHFQALMMASPLAKPVIYGVSTTNEWVVREFIRDKENNPTIYKGLPLHTEYRLFVDFDEGRVIGMSPYWEPGMMEKRFGHEEDADSPHQIHDYVIYKSHKDILMARYEQNKDRVKAELEKLLPDISLNGQWSVDIMQNGDEFWIIDMALAENSALYDCVPKELRRPSKENWIPEIPELTGKD